MSKLEWGKPTEGWELSLSLDKEQFVVDYPVKATIVARNISNKILALPVFSPWTTYQFQLRYGSSDVPLTRFAKRMEKNKMVASRGSAAIEPKDEVVQEVSLSRLFDLSELGKYTVEASRKVPKAEGWEEASLISNTISFEIVEEEKEE